MKYATNPYDITHLTLGLLLHYIGKLKMQIFYRYSAHMKEYTNKLHFMVSTFLFIHKCRYF